MKSIIKILILAITLSFASCSADLTSDSSSLTGTSAATSDCNGDDTSLSSDLPDWIKNNFTCVTAYMDGTNIIIETDSVPNHKSPYFETSNSNWESMPASGDQKITNFLSQTYEFTIAETPTALGSPTSNFSGAIGVSVNGVTLFAGKSSTGALDDELDTFDSAQGHPNGGTQTYHYHAENLYQTDYETSLFGVMADGYPIYGPLEEDGSTPGDTTPSLDTETFGHTHATNDFPSGIFHYHLKVPTVSDTSSSFGISIPIMPEYRHGVASGSNVSN